ncbi:hypothetical protein MYX07_05135 [Patescibacteria group bacterium AH-259-L07]|nr:hypothetical protein [Patescibacteria group bacterium AH-259-L07]
MAGKSVKLIVGIVLLVVAILLYLFGGLSYWLAIAVVAIGLIFVILSFLGKEKLPALTPQVEKPQETTKTAETPQAAAPAPEDLGVEVPSAPPSEPAAPSGEEQKPQA